VAATLLETGLSAKLILAAHGHQDELAVGQIMVGQRMRGEDSFA
jgi:hypothetical protein